MSGGADGAAGNRYIDGSYAASNPDYHSEDSAWKAAMILAALDRLGTPLRRITEIGCGVGGVIASVARARPDIACHGRDISPQAIARASATHGPVADFATGGIDRVPAETDCIICCDVIEHVDDPYAFCRNVAGRAAVAIFHIPIELSVKTLLRPAPLRNSRAAVGHIHFFTRPTAEDLLRECGLHIVQSHWTFQPKLPRKAGMPTRLAHVIRRVAFAIAPGLVGTLLGGCSLLVVATSAKPHAR